MLPERTLAMLVWTLAVTRLGDALVNNERLPLQEKISPDLQPLALNLFRRWWRDDSLLRRSIEDGFDHPLPANMASSVDSPSCAAALVNFHPPVVAVGRNCECIRHRGRDHHAE